jgi:hypothetical protein
MIREGVLSHRWGSWWSVRHGHRVRASGFGFSSLFDNGVRYGTTEVESDGNEVQGDGYADGCRDE